MTSIYSGNLMRSFVKDQNIQRRENFDVSRYDYNPMAAHAQGRLEKELRDGLEYHQAQMADLQTKANELTEKLNNLYRQYQDAMAFSKPKAEPRFIGTSEALNALPDISNPSGLPNDYPTGAPNNLLPFGDPGRIRNYSYNPYFGSKAIDESDQQLIRTYWEQPGVTSEEAYRENGAFWNAVSYLWGWDVDRINAAYATTTNQDNKQVNVTALQPNKPQQPPLRPGDRFPINWTEDPNDPGTMQYPAVNITGLRPGGVDYSHATDSLNTGGDAQTQSTNITGPAGNGSPGNGFFVEDASFLAVNDAIRVTGTGAVDREVTQIIPAPIPGFPNRAEIITEGWNPYGSPIDSGVIEKIIPNSTANTNVVGNNSINWGWEFDDLPISLEVVSVSQQPDGNTVPTEYKVVYDIPPNHPFYEELKVLNGTEPMIIDAPTEMRKERINNNGFNYTGTTYFPGSNVVGFQVGPRFRTSRGAWVVAQPGETEYSAPGHYTIADGPIAAFELETCLPGLEIDADTRVSFQYRYRVHQNSAQFGSTYDDSGPGVPTRFGFTRHDWNSAGNEAFGSGNTFGVPLPGGYQTLADEPGDTLLLLGQSPSANTSGTDYLKVSGNEQLYAKIVPGSTTDRVRVEFYFEGDLNQLEIEVSDFQIVDYDGDNIAGDSWTQGKYNAGNVNPIIQVGDPTVTSNPDDVISKYYPNVFQFTQFNDQYTNSYTNFDRNDIVRSPWEFGLLNIDEGSGLSGEMWLNLNGRRLNLDHDAVDNLVMLWDGTMGTAQDAGTAIVQGDAVHKAYEFVPDSWTQAVTHPGDDCGPNPEMNISGSNTGTGFPYNPDAPSGGIAVDSLTGFSVGDQVMVNGAGPYTITAIVEDAGSPGGVTNDPVFDDPAVPTYEVRAPFDGSVTVEDSLGDPIPMPPANYDGSSLPIPPGAYPVTIDGVVYATYAAVAAAFAPAASHPHVSDPTNPLYWVPYTQSTAPTIPARREVYLNAPVTPAPNSGSITPLVVTPEPPRVFQYADADPLSNYNQRHTLIDDEVMVGEAPLSPGATPYDPGRTANPVAGDPNNNGFDWADPNFYNRFGDAFTNPISTTNNPTNFITGTSTDAGYNTNPDYAHVDGTIDRVGGADLNIQYRISIPTADVNVLRKENNLLFNVGAIDERDWGIEIVNPYMEFRTSPAYISVPRYRVDAGGNIFDRFGKGYYEDDASRAEFSQADADSVERLYTTSGGATLNNQVSNVNRDYDYSNYETYDDSAADFASFIDGKNRLSMNGDDYNLFDYIPDLNMIAGDPEGASYGEVYVGSLPTNFYYYREGLDQSVSGSGTPFTAGIQNDNGRAALNFNGNATNRTGVYNHADTTVVHNTEIPSWVNVKLGVAQQNAAVRNQERTTSWARWDGFDDAGVESSMAQSILEFTDVDTPFGALGEPNTQVARMQPDGSSITLNMGQEINRGGHLLLHEFISGRIQPHVIPLPLKDVGDFPDQPPTSYTFAAYGNETVTRTGSRYISNFGTAILDGLDGQFDGSWTGGQATNLLQAAGAEVSTSHPPASWGEGLILHVDDASTFSVDHPQNQVYLGNDESQRYRIGAKNVNSSPQTLFLIPEGGSVPTALQNRIHTDLQVRQFTGQYTVSVVDDSNNMSANGQYLRIDYDDRGTDLYGELDAVEISAEMDRVGRLAGDDPRTPGIENNRIGPEIFSDPQGYIQSDARVGLNLVSKDKDGNPTVKKLRAVNVTVESGEQIIPFTMGQEYSTTGPFDINGTWPLALFDDDRQLNPEVTPDINVLVGLRQGITDGSQATDPSDPRITLASTAGFGAGEDIYINGQLRKVVDVIGNDIVLDSPLSKAPIFGDVAHLGKNDKGERELAMFLNKSYAMSAGAPVKIELIYDTYEVTGYPPQVDLSTSMGEVRESIGFSDSSPSDQMKIDPANTGTGTAANPIVVDSTAGFSQYDEINIHGHTYRIENLTATTIELNYPIDPAPTTGTLTRTDYDNHLVVGKGRSGGAYNNTFTTELKRILDDPQYKDVLRQGLFKNVFITASVTDPFNDIISSRLMLDWDRRQREMGIHQLTFAASYQSL